MLKTTCKVFKNKIVCCDEIQEVLHLIYLQDPRMTAKVEQNKELGHDIEILQSYTDWLENTVILGYLSLKYPVYLFFQTALECCNVEIQSQPAIHIHLMHNFSTMSCKSPSTRTGKNNL